MFGTAGILLSPSYRHPDIALSQEFLHARGQCPLPCPFSYARLCPGTPEHAPLRLRTEQLVAGIRHPDLNLPALNP